MFSGPFRKRGIVLLATYMQIYKKDDVGVKGSTVFTNVPLAKLEESACHPTCGGHCCEQTS